MLHFAGQRRTRADNAHIASQNVEELRQLIERILAQEAAEAGDAGIVGDLEEHAVALVHVHDFGATLLCIQHHSAELDAAEDHALFADAIRGVEDRAGRIELDGDGDGHQQGRKRTSVSTEKTVSKTRLKKRPSSGTSPRCNGMVGNWPMYSMGLFQATESYMSGTTRRSTP